MIYVIYDGLQERKFINLHIFVEIIRCNLWRLHNDVKAVGNGFFPPANFRCNPESNIFIFGKTFLNILFDGSNKESIS